MQQVSRTAPENIFALQGCHVNINKSNELSSSHRAVMAFYERELLQVSDLCSVSVFFLQLLLLSLSLL